MKSKWMLTSVMLVAIIAAGCGSKPAETPTTPATSAPAQQETARQETATPASTPASSSSGKKYVAVTGSSEAAYHVRETFLGKDLNVTAVGKTSAFTGEINLEGGVIKPSVIKVDLSTLKSDEDRRDNRVRQALDTTNHQSATFQITGAEGNPTLQEGKETPVKLQGTMTIKGTEKPLTFDGKATLNGDALTVTAESTFPMTTFGVNPPNIAGFVSVVDEVKLTITYVGQGQ